MSENFWDELDKTIEDQSAGGGGIVALTEIQLGYKVYANNSELEALKMTQANTFFPASKKDEVKAAEAAAKKLCEKLGPDNKGEDRRASYGVMIVCHKANAITSKKGEWGDVTWKEDRQMFEPLWKSKKGEMSDGYKVVVPALKTLGNTPPIKSWMYLTFAKSPSGKTKKDENGEPKPALICYPVKMFMDEKSAKAEATSGRGSNGNGSVTVPEGYTSESWAKLLPKLKVLQAKGKSIEQIADDYDLNPEVLAKALA